MYMGRFQGQMPHWLGLKSQNFHNLSGIDKYGTRIKKSGQKLHINAQAAQVRSMTGDRCYEYNYQESNILLNLQIIKVYMGTLSVIKITPNF